MATFVVNTIQSSGGLCLDPITLSVHFHGNVQPHVAPLPECVVCFQFSIFYLSTI